VKQANDIELNPEQESVRDASRPLVVEPMTPQVRIEFGGKVIADTC
jgi:uncharacterized protein (DUF427 family)